MFSLHRVQAGATPRASAIEFDFECGLRESYRHFGVGEAAFTLSPRARVTITHIVVRDEHGAVVGGARVHRASLGTPLPALRALRDAPVMRAALLGDGDDGLVELASLWVKRDAGLRGLGRLVGQASIAAAAVDGAQRAVTFSHLTIAGMLHAIGMRPTPDAEPIGYPNANYQSTVWEVDPNNPDHANPEDRDQIALIRNRWTEDPSASLALESTTRPELGWSVVGVLQPAPRPERVSNHVQAHRPRFVRISKPHQAGADPRLRTDG